MKRVEILGSNLYITRKLLGMNEEMNISMKRDAVADNMVYMVWFYSALFLTDNVKVYIAYCFCKC